MKKAILFLSYLILSTTPTLASESCFLAKENGKVIKSEGDCKTRYTPQSTFKIALSLIGFDSKILKDENTPSWPFKKEYDHYVNVCKGDHNPRTWMRDSCLWYSKELTTKLGMEKFQEYVTKFSYGNIDLSGGLTKAWVTSSLKISPDEQADFLQKIVERKLPISNTSYDNAKKTMFIQELAGGWKLYGKTGNGNRQDNPGLQHGWFVGYIEKDNRKVVFSSHLVDKEKHPSFASQRARNEALIQLWNIIEEFEKNAG